jgi:hypothetical protein
MAFTECANGHLYDPDQYATCPYCNGGGNRNEFSGAGSSDIGKTAPVGGGFGPSSGAGFSPAPSGSMSEIGATVAPQSYRKKEEAKEEDTGKTVGVFKKSMNL